MSFPNGWSRHYRPARLTEIGLGNRVREMERTAAPSPPPVLLDVRAHTRWLSIVRRWIVAADPSMVVTRASLLPRQLTPKSWGSWQILKRIRSVVFIFSHHRSCRAHFPLVQMKGVKERVIHLHQHHVRGLGSALVMFSNLDSNPG